MPDFLSKLKTEKFLNLYLQSFLIIIKKPNAQELELKNSNYGCSDYSMASRNPSRDKCRTVLMLPKYSKLKQERTFHSQMVKGIFKKMESC